MESYKYPRILAPLVIAVLGGFGLAGCNLLPQNRDVSPVSQPSSKVPLNPSGSAMESRLPSPVQPSKTPSVGNTNPTRTVSVSVKSQPSIVRLPYIPASGTASVETLPRTSALPGPEVVPQ